MAHGIAQDVAREVRAEMGRQQKTGAELARVLGISSPTAYSRIHGRTPFDTEELGIVADWLGVEVGQFIPAREATA